MVEDRKLAVLRAIVEDYVATEEPVGSKALVERHGLGVSPATVRNDMAALEDEGYIAQPHTSAGRVPTDKGYRLFVDRLTTVKPMSAAERRAISTFLDGAVDLDDVVQRSVRLLAQLTRQVASCSTPRSRRSTVRHVELVALGADPAAGGADPQHRAGSSSASSSSTTGARRRATSPTCGRRSTGPPSARSSPTRPRAAAGRAVDLPGRRSAPSGPRPTHAAVVEALREAMSDHRSDERVVVGGAANLARFGDSFDSAVRPLLEALEEHVVLLKLLGEADAGDAVTVRIGHEGPYQELVGDQRRGQRLRPWRRPARRPSACVGPTRMDYPGSMAAVRAVARYVSRILDEA